MLFIYLILTAICVYGCLQIRTYFSLDLYVTPDFDNWIYLQARDNLLQFGITPSYYVYIPD